jgi:multisubunit Na+/H+ antiporter MnhC subunit
MAMFDYAMILASIVIGLALTHLMQGLAGLIQ